MIHVKHCRIAKFTDRKYRRALKQRSPEVAKPRGFEPECAVNTTQIPDAHYSAVLPQKSVSRSPTFQASGRVSIYRLGVNPGHEDPEIRATTHRLSTRSPMGANDYPRYQDAASRPEGGKRRTYGERRW